MKRDKRVKSRSGEGSVGAVVVVSRNSPAKKDVGDDAGTPNVDLDAVLLVANDFWGDVVWRARHVVLRAPLRLHGVGSNGGHSRPRDNNIKLTKLTKLRGQRGGKYLGRRPKIRELDVRVIVEVGEEEVLGFEVAVGHWCRRAWAWM